MSGLHRTPKQLARWGIPLTRSLATARTNRSEGSIGDAFSSLSDNKVELPPRFSQLKNDMVGPNGQAIVDSWHRLLKHLKTETLPRIKELSSTTIPEVKFSDIAKNGGLLPSLAWHQLRECGTIIIRGIVPEEQALGWKESVREYVRANPSTKGFPANNIQVYEIYWSKAQLEARAHKNMLSVQVALNLAWDKMPDDKVVLSEPTTYCDRLRMRTPGDESFSLGPHLDGGSLERWEDLEYRKCYKEILQGRWEQHKGWQIGPRLNANVDMYNGPGGCSAFRSYQGWLSLSECGPGNGTLAVMPDVKASTAYTMLRPFVSRTSGKWTLDRSSPYFHGAAMGAGQELLSTTHAHISPTGFVSIPTVRPGDAVFWHCDVAHMVENKHNGDNDASVFYIPVAPLCNTNTQYLKRQRLNFLQGHPPPDFPGGLGESEHIGRGNVDVLPEEAARAMGCIAFDPDRAVYDGERDVYQYANKFLGF